MCLLTFNKGIKLLQPQSTITLFIGTFQQCLPYRWSLYRQSMHICERNVATRGFYLQLAF